MNGVGLLIVIYLLFVAWHSLYRSSMGTWSTSLYYSFAFIFIILSIKCIVDKDCLSPFRDNISKCYFLLSLVSGIYSIIITCVTMWMVSQNRTPFHMELTSVGPFLCNQLLIIFVINMIVVITEYVRMVRRNESIHLDLVLSIAVIHQVLIYINLFHRLTTIEECHRNFFFGTVMIIFETVIGITVLFFIQKCTNKNIGNEC